MAADEENIYDAIDNGDENDVAVFSHLWSRSSNSASLLPQGQRLWMGWSRGVIIIIIILQEHNLSNIWLPGGLHNRVQHNGEAALHARMQASGLLGLAPVELRTMGRVCLGGVRSRKIQEKLVTLRKLHRVWIITQWKYPVLYPSIKTRCTSVGKTRILRVPQSVPLRKI